MIDLIKCQISPSLNIVKIKTNQNWKCFFFR